MLEALHAATQQLQAETGPTAVATVPPQAKVKGGRLSQKRGAVAVRGSRLEDTGETSSDPRLEICTKPMSLDKHGVRSLSVPQANLSLARRALDAAGSEVPDVVQDFVRAMESFYAEFVPQKFEAAIAAAAAREAEQALAHAEDVAELAGRIVQVTNPPQCHDAEGVVAVAGLARQQLEALAARGLALPALYVEHVRQAIDSAGMAFLDAPPDADPGERLKWSEAVVAIQLAPLPELGQCLASIARTINVEQLEDHACGKSAPSLECQRLLVAAIWAVKAECRCDSSWGDIRQMVGEGAGSFVQVLVDWDPVQNSSADRLCRARELLLGLWRWAATGCGGSAALQTLFAWVSLAVALLPISVAGQRLQLVHQRLRRGLAKVSEAAPEQAQKAREKAWTAALFLLDSPDEEAWWWLQLIRPASSRTPWADVEEAGEAAGPPEAVVESEGPAPELAGEEGDGGKAPAVLWPSAAAAAPKSKAAARPTTTPRPPSASPLSGALNLIGMLRPRAKRDEGAAEPFSEAEIPYDEAEEEQDALAMLDDTGEEDPYAGDDADADEFS
mmetsp:Transcript_53905/g.150574  ORF Transcript_53905/g.150574 Transcript_53905/m.150574 type:complete len:560 (+) Transcript_53905:3-1682(+)